MQLEKLSFSQKIDSTNQHSQCQGQLNYLLMSSVSNFSIQRICGPVNIWATERYKKTLQYQWKPWGQCSKWLNQNELVKHFEIIHVANSTQCQC